MHQSLEETKTVNPKSQKPIEKMVGLEGFEPPTHGLGNRCSIRLSYRPILPLSDLLLEDYIRNEIKETPTAEDGPAAVRAARPPPFNAVRRARNQPGRHS